jgi:hypothetical protein
MFILFFAKTCRLSICWKIKWCKFISVHTLKVYGGPEVQLHSFWASAVDGGQLSTSRLCFSSQWTGVWVGPISGHHVLEQKKILSLPACEYFFYSVTKIEVNLGSVIKNARLIRCDQRESQSMWHERNRLELLFRYFVFILFMFIYVPFACL